MYAQCPRYPKADIAGVECDVRYVPKTDIPVLGACSRYVTICLMVLRTSMSHRLAIIAMTLLSGFAGGQVVAQETIGTVSRIQGEASGTRGGATRALGLNSSVIPNESVSTGAAARLEVTFKDNTRLTLGRTRS